MMHGPTNVKNKRRFDTVSGNGQYAEYEIPGGVLYGILTFRHHASSLEDRRFTTLQITLFIFLINKYISLSDIYLTVHH